MSRQKLSYEQFICPDKDSIKKRDDYLKYIKETQRILLSQDGTVVLDIKEEWNRNLKGENMFDINEIVNRQLDNAYRQGRKDTIDEIMDLLGKHNAKHDTTYISFVQDLIELSSK